MDKTMQIDTHQMKSPLGTIRLYANKQSLIGVFLEQEKKTPFHEFLKKAVSRKGNTNPAEQNKVPVFQNEVISQMKLDSTHPLVHMGNPTLRETPSLRAKTEVVHKSSMEIKNSNPILFRAEQELLLYFAGKEMTFTVPTELFGTSFQKAVWQELQHIAPGELQSYGDIAKKLSSPQASRAVGAAIGSNPLSIIIPCHRVIGKAGHLTGYAGGLPAKTWLLTHEGHKVSLSQRLNPKVRSESPLLLTSGLTENLQPLLGETHTPFGVGR